MKGSNSQVRHQFSLAYLFFGITSVAMAFGAAGLGMLGVAAFIFSATVGAVVGYLFDGENGILPGGIMGIAVILLFFAVSMSDFR